MQCEISMQIPGTMYLFLFSIVVFILDISPEMPTGLTYCFCYEAKMVAETWANYETFGVDVWGVVHVV